MESNKIILLLISLSCLFSLSSASRPDPSSASARAPASGPSSAVVESLGDDASFNILPENADPDLQKICGSTDHPIECVQTSAVFLSANDRVDPLSILAVELEVLTDKTKEALEAAAKISADAKTAEAVVSGLETCIEGYNAVLESNQKILDAIAERDSYVLNMELSSNVQNMRGCKDAFEETEVTSPLSEIDELIGMIINNTLAIGVDQVHF